MPQPRFAAHRLRATEHRAAKQLQKPRLADTIDSRFLGLSRPRSLLKKGTGSEQPLVLEAIQSRREVPVPFFNRAPLAQLDRASVYGTEGYWFESSRV